MVFLLAVIRAASGSETEAEVLRVELRSGGTETIVVTPVMCSILGREIGASGGSVLNLAETEMWWQSAPLLGLDKEQPKSVLVTATLGWMGEWPQAFVATTATRELETERARHGVMVITQPNSILGFFGERCPLERLSPQAIDEMISGQSRRIRRIVVPILVEVMTHRTGGTPEYLVGVSECVRNGECYPLAHALRVWSAHSLRTHGR